MAEELLLDEDVERDDAIIGTWIRISFGLALAIGAFIGGIVWYLGRPQPVIATAPEPLEPTR